MNLFFSINSKDFKTRLTIPEFSVFGKTKKTLRLFECEPVNNRWIIRIHKKNINYEEFYEINSQNLKNNNFYFLSDINIVKKFSNENNIYFLKKLFYFDSFTDTEVNFRANLEIYNKSSFSSYQSDYPYNLIDKKSGIVSPVSILLNKNSIKNKIFLKNIDANPTHIEFFAYLIDKKRKIIINKYKVYTNSSNEINLHANEIDENYYIFTERNICIPIYVSISKTNISMEHTHPPHHYIYGESKFKIVQEFKKQFYEIINQKN